MKRFLIIVSIGFLLFAADSNVFGYNHLSSKQINANQVSVNKSAHAFSKCQSISGLIDFDIDISNALKFTQVFISWKGRAQYSNLFIYLGEGKTCMQWLADLSPPVPA